MIQFSRPYKQGSKTHVALKRFSHVPSHLTDHSTQKELKYCLKPISLYSTTYPHYFTMCVGSLEDLRFLFGQSVTHTKINTFMGSCRRATPWSNPLKQGLRILCHYILFFAFFLIFIRLKSFHSSQDSWELNETKTYLLAAVNQKQLKLK